MSESNGSQTLAANSKNFAPILLPRSAALTTNLLSVAEVARLLGVCAATVYNLCARGQLEHVRILNSIRVLPASLDAFVLTSGRLS
jgi:excisionase family DNA binding protein